MPDKELVDYIKSVKDKGYKDHQIVEHLKRYGYTDSQIDEAYKGLNKKIDTTLNIIYVLIALLVIVLMIFIGSSVYETVTAEDPACENVEIGLYSYDNINYFCNKVENNLNIQLPIENKGELDIIGLDIIIEGEKNYREAPELNIKSGEIFPKVIDYDISEYGEAKSIRIIPKAKSETKLITCKSQAIESTLIC